MNREGFVFLTFNGEYIRFVRLGSWGDKLTIESNKDINLAQLVTERELIDIKRKLSDMDITHLMDECVKLPAIESKIINLIKM